MLNNELQKQQPDLFNDRLYVFEAFTSEEVEKISPDNDSDQQKTDSTGFRESAKEL